MLDRKLVPYIQVNRCKACGICSSACPHGCLDLVDGIGALVRPEACISEGACVEACQTHAIRMRWMSMDGNSSVGRWRAARAVVHR